MAKRTPNFERILSPSPPRAAAADSARTAYRSAADGLHGAVALTAAEIDAVLDIAWAMATANGELNVEEHTAYAALVRHLRPEVAVRRFLADRPAWDGDEEYVRKAAARLLTRTARETAYKAAYVIRVIDLESNTDEEVVDALLVEVLDLGDAAGDLAFEVNDALATP